MCSLDGASASACSSPKTVKGLSEGQHAFQVWAVGPNGQRDPVGVAWMFTVLFPPPGTVATGGPSGTINSSSASFSFSSSESHSTFLCSLDGASPSSCSSSRTVHGLSDGDHLFQVWAVGPDGQQDPAGVTWAFTVLTAPAAVSSPSVSSSSAQVGQTVSCDSGSWSGQPTISYRWYSQGAPITDSESSGDYTPQRSDAGQDISCQVLAANAAGQTERTAGDVRIGQFALLGELSFPTSLQAARLRSLSTLSFQSSNAGSVSRYSITGVPRR